MTVWPVTLLKKKFWQRRFPVNFVKFLRTPFLQNTSGRLLLELVGSSKLKGSVIFKFIQFWIAKDLHCS